MMEGGSPIDASDGPGPMIRACLMPAEHWEIRDTWHTFGLKGTGSHHVALTDVFVPDENFFEVPFGSSFAPDLIFAMFAEVLMLAHAAVAVGIAEGAIMDLVELAGTGVKQQFMTTPLVETERFKEGLARLDAELMAARALLEAQITRVWQNPERAVTKDMSRVAEQLQAAVWITSACVRVAEGCFELAGSRAVYESSPLQRRSAGSSASRPNTWRSSRATTLWRGPPCSRVCHPRLYRSGQSIEISNEGGQSDDPPRIDPGA